MGTSEQDGDSISYARKRAAVLLLLLCIGMVLLITLYPIAPSLADLGPLEVVFSWLGVPAGYAGSVLEVILNVLMFVPLGVLLVSIMPSLRFWWVAILTAAALSLGVELVQLIALAGRSATVIDFVANSAGGAIGAGMAFIWLRALARRKAHSATVAPEVQGDTG